MSRASGRNRRRSGRQRGRTLPAALLALTAFGVLATTPIILRALNLHLQPVALRASHGVILLPAPRMARPVPLPPVAQPIQPLLAPAAKPVGHPEREAALVSAEDARIRVLLHDAVRIYQPEVLPIRASLPTLVLTAGSRPYTAADLAQYGALVFLRHDAALLLDNVFVSTNAKLSLGSARLHTLYMDSSTGGFASIVAWGGDLEFQGTATWPLTIMGWDRATNSRATDQGYGRSYIREVGGKMTLTNVRVTSLGFWSGRTGGVAWTGVVGQPSTGGATNATFTSESYGAFVSRTQGVTFAADLFEFNQLDGLHVHRYAIGTTVVASSAVRNGGNGFLVDRATQTTLMRDEVSEHNNGNGFLIDGRPLVSGASASGSAVAPGSGATVEQSAAIRNGKSGILVEGGVGTVIEANQVCATVTGIAAKYQAMNTVITGNDVRCGPRSGLSIGPAAPGAVVSGNAVDGARIGILVRSSGSVEVDNNLITDARVFGISARGLTSRVRGVGNVISGPGFRAIDARADASTPALSGSNLAGWQHHVKITFVNYLLFHPLAALWLSILVLVLGCFLWARRRRLPPHPYHASTRWRPASAPTPAAAAGLDLGAEPSHVAPRELVVVGSADGGASSLAAIAAAAWPAPAGTRSSAHAAELPGRGESWLAMERRLTAVERMLSVTIELPDSASGPAWAGSDDTSPSLPQVVD